MSKIIFIILTLISQLNVIFITEQFYCYYYIEKKRYHKKIIIMVLFVNFVLKTIKIINKQNKTNLHFNNIFNIYVKYFISR